MHQSAGLDPRPFGTAKILRDRTPCLFSLARAIRSLLWFKPHGPITLHTEGPGTGTIHRGSMLPHRGR